MYAAFKGAAKALEDIDLPRIGYEIGVGEDVIHAIIDVEAPKSGFDTLGRPRILFEPHVLFRNLSGSLQTQAVSEGLAYKSWRKGAYGKESEQYGKLERALKIDQTAALKACSWGRSQILGENHLLAGYATPQDMVTDFCDDEDNHIEAMVRFLKAKSLDAHLRRIDKLNRPSTPADWKEVAAGYNGTGQVEYYSGELAKRHNWWRGKPDTPWSPLDLTAPAPRQETHSVSPPAPAVILPTKPTVPVVDAVPQPAPAPAPLTLLQRLQKIFGRA